MGGERDGGREGWRERHGGVSEGWRGCGGTDKHNPLSLCIDVIVILRVHGFYNPGL